MGGNVEGYRSTGALVAAKVEGRHGPILRDPGRRSHAKCEDRTLFSFVSRHIRKMRPATWKEKDLYVEPDGPYDDVDPGK